MAGAARDVVAIATAIGNICTAIEGHIVEKSTLKSLLKLYESRLKNNGSFIELGLQLRHCQPYAINAYDTIVCTGEWLASKHIKLANASGGILSRSRWKFPWKFAGKKRANFQFLLQQLRQDLDNLVDCIQSSGHIANNNLLYANLPAGAGAALPQGYNELRDRAQQLLTELG